ncbi:PWWP domain-containing protein 5 [Cardamine amara subsp. amara]|uniref:PWWP domain-containing protein 5 n=1 Tax=Cardamine amara subsp. amara TaxID=228776 RepID=A0ABD1AFA7_CARAN
MSTEPGGVESDSNADLSANASRFEYGVAHTSETLTDPVSFQAQDLLVKLTGVERKGCVSAHGDNICNVVDSDDIGENLDGVVLAGSDLLKSKDKNGFANENLKLFESDLVWAKIRSYPWWPGQVLDSSVASKNAMKHFKKGKGNLLVAYFGDSTVAWNNAFQIKPFHQHFSLMQKQSNSEKFLDAIDCVLEEVSRRVEFGLSCPCISKEAYNKLKTQNIISPGIREDSRLRYGGDMLSDAMSFKPAKLVAYMKDLACFPSYDATEKLQFVTNRSQLLAFQQWKDYSHFLEYETFLRSVESTVPKASLLEPNTDDYNDNDEHKQMFDFEDKSRTDEKTQEKTLSDFNAKKRFGSKSTEELDGKSHADKKRKVESSEVDISEKKDQEQPAKRGFRV